VGGKAPIKSCQVLISGQLSSALLWLWYVAALLLRKLFGKGDGLKPWKNNLETAMKALESFQPGILVSVSDIL